ncbi:riboflavin synthase [Lactiplantibacillus plajomi]|uniref:Riboflavin synthase n=1 Tax=Lactiplantibacillus plajomi TaxID=1457217 RepID=A0ABV6K3K8_9LACO|nr:riboflavin synthase [Lactiplantibacillus plajomi]
MFTGIIKTVGTVTTVRHLGQALRLTVNAPAVVTPTLPIGASIAINGTCLTVVTKTATDFSADVMPESVRRTNLGQLTAGARVNVEPALKPEDGLDGHFVQGHVDYCGRFVRKQHDQNALRLWFSLPQAYQPYVVEKGAVAVDGVSLTVVAVNATEFEIDLIPHSQAVTTLSQLRPGAPVNIETDMIGKYVAKLVRERKFA